MKSLLRVIAAVALLAVFSCTKDPEDNPERNDEARTYTMTVFALKGDIGTKALDLTGGTISATWTAGDRVTVYNKTRSAGLEGSLEAQGGGSSTTLTGKLTGIVGANDELALSFQGGNYAAQDGTLEFISANCDYETADVKVKSVKGGNITTTADASFDSRQAIVEFTLKENDGSDIAGGVKSLIVTADGTTINVTPGAAAKVLYVAMPAVSRGTVSLNALDSDGAPRSCELTAATFENGQFYKVGVQMDCIVKDYAELRAAAALSKVPKITLGADIAYPKPSSTVSCITIGGDETIDLHGYSIAGYRDGDAFDRIFYVGEGKSLTIIGPGTLKNGRQNRGGAIYNAGSLTLSDCSITGNSADTGGGIYNAGTLILSGSTVVSGNTAGGAVSNVYLADGKVITVAGAFTEGASIGVTLAGGRGVFTSGYSSVNGSKDPAAVFSSDAASYLISLSGDEVAVAPYRLVSTKPYANLSVLLNETGLLSALGSMGQLVVNANFTAQQQNAPVSAINYTYLSTDPQGSPVELSALMYVPDAAFSGSGLAGMCLTNHGTIASNAECPTLRAQFEGAFAWKNYAIVMPDYYGFGASADRPQGYLDAENTAHNSIDAYLAAVEMLKDRGAAIPERLFSFGYSQGGFNSMGNLRYVSMHPELGIRFSKVFCGGSPFDVMETWSAYTNGTFQNSLAFVPMTLVSVNETHKLGIAYSDLFKGALLSNWQEWILSKQYTTSQISDFLSPDPSHPATIADILNPNMIAGTGAAFNAIKSVCESYSLTSGWMPPSGTDIILYHSNQDDTVPYSNLPAMKAFLDKVAPGSYTAYDGNNGGHMAAVLWYVLHIIGEW